MADLSWITDSGAWVGLLTLVALEVVLGIDNIVFISILSNKLPENQRAAARKKGLILAVIPRIVFLLLLGIILSLQDPLFYLPFEDPDPERQAKSIANGHEGNLGLSGQNLVLIIGGLFLLVQAVREIHHKLEGPEAVNGSGGNGAKAATWAAVLTQIMFMNIIFSLDSIITAIGMVKQVPVMVLAVLVSTGIMIYAVEPISRFVEKHPTVKMLALAFLLLIGTNLIAEAIHFHIPKGYVYFAMAFSVGVEMLNIRASRGKSHPVHLHPPA
ncbi:MAG: TerC family protein [Verrucomicrobiales bacterium]|nr:TerC family protein [Verrucomicrobiales bacterium]